MNCDRGRCNFLCQHKHKIVIFLLIFNFLEEPAIDDLGMTPVELVHVEHMDQMEKRSLDNFLSGYVISETTNCSVLSKCSGQFLFKTGANIVNCIIVPPLTRWDPDTEIMVTCWQHLPSPTKSILPTIVILEFAEAKSEPRKCLPSKFCNSFTLVMKSTPLDNGSYFILGCLPLSTESDDVSFIRVFELKFWSFFRIGESYILEGKNFCRKGKCISYYNLTPENVLMINHIVEPSLLSIPTFEGEITSGIEGGDGLYILDKTIFLILDRNQCALWKSILRPGYQVRLYHPHIIRNVAGDTFIFICKLGTIEISHYKSIDDVNSWKLGPALYRDYKRLPHSQFLYRLRYIWPFLQNKLSLGKKLFEQKESELELFREISSKIEQIFELKYDALHQCSFEDFANHFPKRTHNVEENAISIPLIKSFPRLENLSTVLLGRMAKDAFGNFIIYDNSSSIMVLPRDSFNFTAFVGKFVLVKDYKLLKSTPCIALDKIAATINVEEHWHVPYTVELFDFDIQIATIGYSKVDKIFELKCKVSKGYRYKVKNMKPTEETAVTSEIVLVRIPDNAKLDCFLTCFCCYKIKRLVKQSGVQRYKWSKFCRIEHACQYSHENAVDVDMISDDFNRMKRMTVKGIVISMSNLVNGSEIELCGSTKLSRNNIKFKSRKSYKSCIIGETIQLNNVRLLTDTDGTKSLQEILNETTIQSINWQDNRDIFAKNYGLQLKEIHSISFMFKCASCGIQISQDTDCGNYHASGEEKVKRTRLECFMSCTVHDNVSFYHMEIAEETHLKKILNLDERIWSSIQSAVWINGCLNLNDGSKENEVIRNLKEILKNSFNNVFQAKVVKTDKRSSCKLLHVRVTGCDNSLIPTIIQNLPELQLISLLDSKEKLASIWRKLDLL